MWQPTHQPLPPGASAGRCTRRRGLHAPVVGLGMLIGVVSSLTRFLSFNLDKKLNYDGLSTYFYVVFLLLLTLKFCDKCFIVFYF